MQMGGPGRAWEVNAEHRLLLDAIARQDAYDAEQHLAGHIRRTRVELSHHPRCSSGTEQPERGIGAAPKAAHL